jgi:hypothetical protein
LLGWRAAAQTRRHSRRARVAPAGGAGCEPPAYCEVLEPPVPVVPPSAGAGAGAGAGVSVVVPPAAGAISVLGARKMKYSTAITTMTTITPTTHLVLLDIPSLLVLADWLRTINALARKWLQARRAGCMAGMQAGGVAVASMPH